MKLQEMYDDRRGNGDWAWRQSIEQDRNNQAAVRGFWLVVGKKKISGPFTTREKADSFKTNRPDKIPREATVEEL